MLDALAEVRFYLRHSAEDDGTTHYRLFHQGLADHLRGGDAAGRVLDQLIAAVPEDATDNRLSAGTWTSRACADTRPTTPWRPDASTNCSATRPS